MASTGFVLESVRHILTGHDHVPFLPCLLLPAVLRREASAAGVTRPATILCGYPINRPGVGGVQWK